MHYPAKLLIKCKKGIKIFSDMQSLKIFSSHTSFFSKLLDMFHQNERISHRSEDMRSRRQVFQNRRETTKFQGDGKGKSRGTVGQQAQKEVQIEVER